MAKSPFKMLERLLHPFARRTNRAEKGYDEAAELEAIAATEEKAFRYDVLAAATRNFADKLGDGASGHAFKGRLGDGREVAVKRLAIPTRRRRRKGGEEEAEEFVKAATALSRVQHRNIVALHGYCVHGDERLLVYEDLPRGSLHKFIFHSSPSEGSAQTELDWHCRHDILVGVARGLLYLHEGANMPVVHGHINAGNVLLDERRHPKIADFATARLVAGDERARIDGGIDSHMAPEYAMHGHLSPKADVYSFGVLVVELVTGRENSSPVAGAGTDVQCLLEWVWRLHQHGKILELMDPAIRSTADLDQVAVCVHIGLLCTQADPKLRPDMKRVAVDLSKKPSMLEEPTRPGIPGARYRQRALKSTAQ